MNWKMGLTSLICLYQAPSEKSLNRGSFRSSLHFKFLIALGITSSSLLFSADVANSTDLQTAIITANAGGDGTINFTSSIDLTVPFGAPNLRPINTLPDFNPAAFLITLNGNGNQLLGGGSFRGFFARGGTVALNNIKFSRTASFGGNGGDASGGGGAGIGGALIVDTGATVTATNCTFQNSTARGGNGGVGNNNPGPGGGGGFGGNGGVGAFPNYSGGGGGGLDFDGAPLLILMMDSQSHIFMLVQVVVALEKKGAIATNHPTQDRVEVAITGLVPMAEQLVLLLVEMGEMGAAVAVEHKVTLIQAV